MNIVELYGRALDQTTPIVRGVRQDQLGSPTPCTEWDVRALLNHLVLGNWNTAARADESVPRREQGQDLLGTNPSDAFQQSADAAKHAWSQPGRLERMYDMPLGTMPGQAALQIRLLETVTHGWDLAKATGQTANYDDGVLTTATSIAHANLSSARQGGFPFAPPVEIGEDASPVDQLAAFMGRQP